MAATATATVITTWTSPDGNTQYLAFRVNGVEYTASTPAHDSQGNPLTQTTINTNLQAAATILYNNQNNVISAVVGGVTGTFTV